MMTPLRLAVDHALRCLEAERNRPQKCAQCKGVMPVSALRICDRCREKLKRYLAKRRAAKLGRKTRCA